MNTCPSTETLKQFVAATLSDAEADDLFAHLEHCSACTGRLRELEKNFDENVIDGFRELRDRKLDAASSMPMEIGRYEILEKIGEGGMGTVYRALHPNLKRQVAVKVLKASRLNDAVSRNRFEQEMQAVGRLTHENIVTAIDAGFDGDLPYIVMELLDGCDLGEYVTDLLINFDIQVESDRIMEYEQQTSPFVGSSSASFDGGRSHFTWLR